MVTGSYGPPREFGGGAAPWCDVPGGSAGGDEDRAVWTTLPTANGELLMGAGGREGRGREP